MITRVTEGMKYTLMTNNLNNVQSKYNVLMEQLSTQKRINRPSDDPIGTSSVMDCRDSLSSIEQYKKNIDSCASWLSVTESTLSSANDILIKIQEMAVSQASATATSATREQAAAALQPLIDQLISLANTKIGNQYLFSGSMSDTKPFEETDAGAYAGGPATAARDNTYTGTATASGNYDGTTNATYVLNIVDGGVLNAATYRISSDGGKTWSSESNAGDMSSGTVALGGNISLTFDAGTLGAGDVFWVNAFVSGQYRGNGEDLSVNVGKDHTISYSISGESVFTEKGKGTTDIFGTLNTIKSAMETGNADGISSQLENLEAAEAQVTQYQALCGNRSNSLEVTSNNYNALNTNITQLMSNIEDADVTQLIIDYNMKEVALQASYSLAAKIGNISILDFIK
jgi:flagellar hook-associated protein 3 FlgL